MCLQWLVISRAVTLRYLLVLGGACAVGAVPAFAATPTGTTPAPGTTTAPAAAPGTTTTTPTGTGTTTTPGATTTTPPVAAKPPRLTSLKLPRVITAQQGHAQILVGAVTSTPARLRVQILNAATKRLQRTVTAAEVHAAGRVYFLIEATTEQRFQLPAAEYRIVVQATDPQGRSSNALEGRMRLNLTTPRGRMDAYTVPLWPSLAVQYGVPAGGQLVTAVAPGGIAVAAGMRRGDIIRSINGVSVGTPGGMQKALRQLPANTPVVVEATRAAQVLPFQITFKPDWEAAPKYGPSLRVAVKRDPTKLAYAYAHARELAESGDAAGARKAIGEWRATWRTSAAAHLLQADLLTAEDKTKPALGAYNRARVADAQMVAAQVGRGLALSTLNRGTEAADAFGQATTLDPVDAASFAYRAYALLRDGTTRAPEALDAANRAIALDKMNEDGHIARGLALIASNRKPEGVTALKRGLLLLNDPDRARQLIKDSLEPND
jgi:PDZ domain